MTPEALQVLSREDSPADHPRDADDGFEDWLNVSDTPQNKPDHSSKNQSDAAQPQPREITFEGTLRISGYVAGVICSNEGSLIVEAAGELDADISVHDATIYGCLRGDIRARQRVTIGGSGRVVGDIETVALSIEPGAVFEGRCIFVTAFTAADSPTVPDSVWT